MDLCIPRAKDLARGRGIRARPQGSTHASDKIRRKAKLSPLRVESGSLYVQLNCLQMAPMPSACTTLQQLSAAMTGSSYLSEQFRQALYLVKTKAPASYY